jgi:hypothetical protein
MLAGIEIIVVVDDFETYSQFYKINKIAGYLLPLIWPGSVLQWFKYQYLWLNK